MSPFKQAPPGDPLLPVSIPGGAIFSSEGATFFSGDAVLLSEHGGPERVASEAKGDQAERVIVKL